MPMPGRSTLFSTTPRISREWYDNKSFYVEVQRGVLSIAAAATADSIQPIPANHRIISAKVNFDTAFVWSTAVKAGLGTAADPDAYALSATTLTKNLKTVGAGTLVNGAIQTSAATPRLTACDTSGAAAGTGTGTIAYEIVYMVFPSIEDAA